MSRYDDNFIFYPMYSRAIEEHLFTEYFSFTHGHLAKYLDETNQLRPDVVQTLYYYNADVDGRNGLDKDFFHMDWLLNRLDDPEYDSWVNY